MDDSIASKSNKHPRFTEAGVIRSQFDKELIERWIHGTSGSTDLHSSVAEKLPVRRARTVLHVDSTAQSANSGDDAVAAPGHVSSDWSERALKAAFHTASDGKTGTATTDMASTALLEVQVDLPRHRMRGKHGEGRHKHGHGDNVPKLKFRRGGSSAVGTASNNAAADIPAVPEAVPTDGNTAFDVFGADEDDDGDYPMPARKVASEPVFQSAVISGDAMANAGFNSSYFNRARAPVPLVVTGTVDKTILGEHDEPHRSASSMDNKRVALWGENVTRKHKNNNLRADRHHPLQQARQTNTHLLLHAPHVKGGIQQPLTQPQAAWESRVILSYTDWIDNQLLNASTALPFKGSRGAVGSPVGGGKAGSHRGFFSKEDLLVQALHAAPPIPIEDIFAGKFFREPKLGIPGDKTNNASENVSEQLVTHPQLTLDQVLTGLIKRDASSLRHFLPGYLDRFAEIVLHSVVKGRLVCKVHPSRRLLANADRRDATTPAPVPRAPSSAPGAFEAISTTGIRATSVPQISKMEDLSCKDGIVVLFEYVEQLPPLLSAWGMASAVTTYERMMASVQDEEAMSLSNELRDDQAVLARLETGQLRQLRLTDSFPLLGNLDRGQRVTTISNRLFEAPIFKHDASTSDFLLVLRSERDKSQKVAIASSIHMPPGRVPLGYLREIGRIFVVGQLEPKAVVFGPSSRQSKKVTIPYDAEAIRFLESFLCYQLLLLFAAVDDEHQARRSHSSKRSLPFAAIEQDGMLQLGVLRLSDIRKRFHGYCPGLKAETLPKLLTEVADFDSTDAATDPRRDMIIRKIDAPTPDDFREMKGITLEQLCSFESLLAGEEVLLKTGLSQLRTLDKATEDSLQRLYSMYHQLVERLKSSIDDSQQDAWDTDGGYRRMRRTVEIAEAIYYLLQVTPWSTTSNYRDYLTNHNFAALALQDANGAGDPSGRGEGFSFIREFSQRKLHSAARLPHEKREGTSKDERALTKGDLSEMLMEYGMSAEKIRHLGRWKRLDLLKQLRNDYLSLLKAQGHSQVTPSEFAFNGLAKLNPKDRASVKAAQAAEIQRRQYAALSSKFPPALTSEDQEIDEDFLAEQGMDLDQELRAEKRKTFAAVDERLELEKLKNMLASSAAGSMGNAGSGVQLLTSTKSKFPVPQELQRSPPAPLVATEAKNDRLTKDAKRTAMPGNKNPISVGTLSEPPVPATFRFDETTGAYSAAGKVLRIISTTVDASGKQTVRVTYSRNQFAIKQVWLKQRYGIDLGLFGLRYSRNQKTSNVKSDPKDPLMMGVIGTGLYPHPKVAQYMHKEAGRQRDTCRQRLNDLWSLGFILDGRSEASKSINTQVAKAEVVMIHGAPIPVCGNCRLWGHASNSEMCPQPTAAVNPTATTVSGVKRERSDGEVEAPSTTDAKRSRVADESKGLDASKALLSRSGIHERVMPEASIRMFCRILEQVLIDKLNIDGYQAFHKPVSEAVPGYYVKISHPMDLTTLRYNVVARKYTSLDAFYSDLWRIHENSRIFNGDKAQLTSSARKLCSEIKRACNEHKKKLDQCVARMPAEHAMAMSHSGEHHTV